MNRPALSAKPSSARAESLARWKALLPTGAMLPEELWGKRHRIIVGLVFAHAFGLFAFAIVRGYPLVHSFLEVSTIASLGYVASLGKIPRVGRSVAATLGLMAASGLLVHFSGGLIEAHFHFFVMVAVVALYQHWTPFLIAIGFVVLHHGTVGVLTPEAVYNHAAAIAAPWKWAAIHGLFITGESISLLIAWRLVERSWSERDSASLRLIASEERFKSAFSNAVSGMAITSSTGRLLDVNASFCSMLGYSEEEMLKLTWQDVVHPDDRAGTARLYESVTTETEAGQLTTRFTGKNGRILWAEISLSAVLGADRRVQYTVMQANDVTKRHEAEEQVRKSEQRFRALVQNGLDGISVVGADGSILYTSPSSERILNVTAESESGAHFLHRVHPEDDEHAKEMFLSLLSDPEQVRSTELRVRDGKGNWRWISASASNLIDNPAVGGIVVNFRDITEARQMELQLAQSQKMDAIGRLAGGVAHDFNNLLAVIQNYATFAAEGLDEDDARYQDIKEVITAGDKAGDLVRQLLAFSRRQMIAPRTIDLNEIVEGMEKILRRTVAENISMTVKPADRPLRIKADAVQIEQILLNLVVNARDAMPNGGSLLIGTGHADIAPAAATGRQPGRYAWLSVADNGSGMSSETKARMFEPFYTTKPTGKGTGLGLATVYGAVEQSGGFIDVDSVVGEGTRFTIYLPETDEKPVTREIEPIDSASHEDGSETILLVEDEDGVRDVAERILSRAGYRVLAAASPYRAIAIAGSHKGQIDLLLTDVVMPELSGPEVSERLTEESPTLKTLYMSGYTDDIIAVQGVVEEGVAFLEKPFTSESLLGHVRATLSDTHPEPPGQDDGRKDLPTVMIVDDDKAIREVIHLLLKTHDFRVLGEAADGPRAIELVRDLRPDLMVLDYCMPGMNGEQVAARVRELSPHTRIVSFSAVLQGEPGWADAHLEKEQIGRLGELLRDLAPDRVGTRV